MVGLAKSGSAIEKRLWEEISSDLLTGSLTWVCPGVVLDSSIAEAGQLEIRLVNGTSHCNGMVEFLHNGQWGTICDDDWGIEEATVVCRQLRCGPAISATLEAQFWGGTGPIWLDEVRCSGTESELSQCPASNWGEHDCTHEEDAGVVCSGMTLDSDAEDSSRVEIRLVNGSNHCRGRVELLHNGQWGTVCSHYWGLEDARVVCRQLGCGAVKSALQAAKFGRGTGPIWLDDVRCTGTESNLYQCPKMPWGEHDCKHEQDAGVVCSGVASDSDAANSSQVEIRLAEGSSRCSGRVEVLLHGQWGTVCGHGWDMEDARVVCRQLACGGARSALRNAEFGRGTGPIWLNDVRCTGTESTLGQCPARSWGALNCSDLNAAAVVCSIFFVPSELRLINGSSNCSGRIEVFHNQLWGSVCGAGWDLQDANVVCGEMSCGNALRVRSEAWFGQASGPIWLERVNCTGEETSFYDCPRGPWGEHNCSHSQDASVECSETRLVNGSSFCSGRVEVLHNQQWRTVRSVSWNLHDAQVVCREVGCGSALSTKKGPHFGRGHGPFLWKDTFCFGTEAALRYCQNIDIHGEGAAVVCSGNINIRLVGGPNICSGRFELLYNWDWITACKDDLDWNSVQVMCRQLGCGPILSLAAVGGGYGPSFVPGNNFTCEGTEASLNYCQGRYVPGMNLLGLLFSHFGQTHAALGKEVWIRLVNGTNRCSGRVEVLHNQQWLTVCDDGWDLNSAQAVCREHVCGEALFVPRGAPFGRGCGATCLAGAKCRGMEYGFKNCDLHWETHNCSHGEDASVVCSGNSRLVNGTSPCSGRVEVFNARQWGTVCDDGWNLSSAQVVCRQLGCGEALSIKEAAHFGRGNGPILLDEVRCKGTEATLRHCHLQPWGEHNCVHEEDAGVVCSEIRLVNGTNSCSGRVEVLHNWQWLAVCDDRWNLTSAQVVCRELGCGEALVAAGGAHFGTGNGPTWLSGVSCQGTEAAFKDCDLQWRTHDCSHGEVASVVCSGNSYTVALETGCKFNYHGIMSGAACSYTFKFTLHRVTLITSPYQTTVPRILVSDVMNLRLPRCGEEQLRLVNGPSRCSGRIEVLHNRQWGTVCDAGWDLHDAHIVCRELGCGNASKAFGGAWFGQGSGPIWLEGLNCTGEEAFLSECPQSPWGEHSCNHSQDASVECSGDASVEGNIRLGVSALVLLVLVLIMAEAVYSWRRGQL
ncbi:deleted in malignant brain tumors 1 protein-like [Podarcis lilfordi]|uniref:Soluble scavenger receptor cysteine-rich domain-containing protein SSC5D n=1 Tax=Podarcis lilfordi TaxID=74358 RepID=A0AA35L7Q8_9SAUR|nr:deleted in malignant brain tumors 1 protein-like [Podarcis lilfordi]